MKHSFIRGMAFTILATSMAGFAQPVNHSGANAAQSKKSGKQPDTEKSSDQNKNNEPQF